MTGLQLRSEGLDIIPLYGIHLVGSVCLEVFMSIGKEVRILFNTLGCLRDYVLSADRPRDTLRLEDNRLNEGGRANGQVQLARRACLADQKIRRGVHEVRK